MELLALPAFADNYIWMLHDGRRALVVDPGEAGPVESALDEHGLALAGILVTHHHGDHVGGVDALRPRLQGPVFGPAAETIPEPFTGVRSGDSVDVLGLRFAVIDVPGHTRGHIAYFLAAPGTALDNPILFCGDTLFSAGCGRLFEGTPAQMHTSLQRLASLPGNTQVCCGHEYTLANLRFAATVEPDNEDIRRHQAWCVEQRQRNEPTLPSTVARELLINPFLRANRPDVGRRAAQHARTEAHSAVEVFALLREWKNTFQ